MPASTETQPAHSSPPCDPVAGSWALGGGVKGAGGAGGNTALAIVVVVDSGVVSTVGTVVVGVGTTPLASPPADAARRSATTLSTSVVFVGKTCVTVATFRYVTPPFGAG